MPAEGFPEGLDRSDVDLLEWRLDLFLEDHSEDAVRKCLFALSPGRRLPVLVTNRTASQGGAFRGPEEQRLEWLVEAAAAGAEWVDLEDEVSRESLEPFRSLGCRVLLSHHDFSGTPGEAKLLSVLEGMAGRRPDAVKVVTYAREPGDNLRVLGLIPEGRRRFGLGVIAFCMVPLGKWSRAAGLLLGSPWAYVQLPGQGATAPGQWRAEEMREILGRLEGR
jgi:3-dehydroquinate dehydratase-1